MKSAYALFLAALVGTAAFVLATTPGLPDRVGTHFGPGGAADGWMTRDGYRLYMLAFVLLFVPFIVAMVGVLPRVFPRFVNLPNRDYWLAPERREATFAFLAGHACGFGVLTLALLAGVHWLLLDANRASSPHLATAPFVALLATFLVLLAVWMVALFRRFRAPR
jgi:uncharacterized membrane protein